MNSRILLVLVFSTIFAAGCSGGSSNSNFAGDFTDNVAPVVNAGADATIRLPLDSVSLDGTVTDDGRPATATVSTAWTVQEGPDGVLFADPNAVDTDVTFPGAGTYILLLTADDTELQTSDNVTVVVEASPELSEIAVTPTTATLFTGGTQTFSAAGSDQYGDSFPVSITWSATGGTINQAGEYVAGDTTGAFDVTATDGAVIGTAGVTISVSPPTADAGGPYSGAQGSVIALDGSASTDPNDDIVSYAWDLDNDGAYDDAVGVTTNFNATAAGVFTVGLQVTDGDGASGTDTAQVTVTNVPPTANAGPDQAAAQGAAVTLDGSGSSDAGGDALSYSWSLTAPGGSAAVLSDPTAVAPTFNVDVVGSYVATLVVNDGTATSAADTVTVTVSNVAPVANAGPDQGGVGQGATVTLDGSGSSDPGGDALTFSWTLTPPTGSTAVLSDPTAIDPTFVTDVEGNYVAELVVNDGTADSAPDSVTAAVGNDVPTANAGPDQSGVSQGDTVTLDGSGSSDPGGDAITYAWTLTAPTGSSAVLSDDTAEMPTFDTDVAGDYTAELVVNDGSLDSTPDTVTITVDNVAPTANAGPDQAAVAQGATVTLDGSASSDAGGDTLTYAWTLTTRPTGSAAVLDDDTAEMPTFVTDVVGSYVAELVVNDGTVDSAVDTVTITVSNTAPTANAGPDQAAVAQGATVTLDGSASSDPGDDAITYAWTLTTRPTGSAAVLDDGTAEMPTFVADAAGSYEASLVVSDGTDSSAADTVTITVGNTAPTANAGPDQAAVAQGATVTLDGSASSDPGGDAITYAWTLTTRPTGSAAVLDDDTAEMPTFVADAAGSYEASLVVNDGTDSSAADTVAITVDNVAPTANAGPDQTAVAQGANVTLDGSASSDAGGDTLTYAWTLTTRPTGSTAVLDDDTAEMPTFVTDVVGSYAASLVVNDGTADSAADAVTITVSNTAPTANAGPDQVVSGGETVALDGSASSDPGGDALTYAWTLTAPAGSSAVLSDAAVAAPTFVTDLVGSYVAELVVNDGTVDSAADTVTITVDPVQVYWKMDEGAGLTTADSAGSSDGTLIGGAIWTTGVSGAGLDFDGSTGYIRIDNTPELEITGTEITLMAWIYPRDGSEGIGSRVISKRTDAGGSDVYAIKLDEYRICFRLDGDCMTAEHILVLNEWVHVAMVYDGVDQRIYINGVLDPAVPVAKTDSIDASSRQVFLGARDLEARYFNGVLDEVQILNIALSAAEVQAVADSIVPPAPTGLRFTDITVSAGTTNPLDGGRGVMFAEVNSDSLVDSYLTNSRGTAGDPRREYYFENTDGTAFSEAAAARGISDGDGGSYGAVWADLDNDGDYDLYNGSTYDVAPNAGLPVNNNVYENDVAATGLFNDVTPASILSNAIESRAVTAFDMDGDGDLDLFGVPGSATAGVNEAYLNGAIGGAGDFQFSSHVGGVLSTAIAMNGVTDTDYDNDGDIDILGANNSGTGEFAILENDGAGIFSQVLPSTLGIGDDAEQGLTTADVDNDGDLDLLLSSNTQAVLYTRDGGSYSLKQTFDAGWMGNFADLDNDGDLDLVFSGDFKVYLNDGSGTFASDQTVPVSEVGTPRAVALADIDSDGDLDFAIAANAGRNTLVRNDIDATGGNWLRVELKSPSCQAGAFGAKTRIYAAGGTFSTLLGLRESQGNVGFLAQNEPVLHFGLGAEASVDVVVEWVDGTLPTIELGVAANQRILIDACIP